MSKLFEPNFKTSFSSQLKCLVSEEKSMLLAKASLEQLDGLVPLSVRGNRNIDLLPVVFNITAVGLANKNRDATDPKTARAIYKQFINRPINLAHDRDTVVGHIVSSGFSEFGTDKPLTEKETEGLDIFNIALAGVIYRVVNNDLAEMIEDASDPTSPNYMKIHTSWEIGFESHKLFYGSKNLAEATIVPDDKFEEYNKYLKQNKGTGKDKEGNEVYRLITIDAGYVLPLGAAKTLKPAGDVTGVHAVTASEGDTEESQKEDQENMKKAIAEHKKENEAVAEVVLDEGETKDAPPETKDEPPVEPVETIVPEEKEIESEQKEKNISQSEKTNVKEITKDMKIKSVEDITSKWSDLQKQESAASITEFVVDKLKTESEDFSKKLADKQTAFETAQAEIKKFSDEAKQTKAELDKVKADLKALETAQAEKEQEETFNSRMEALAEEYDFDADLSQVVASEINGLNDEDFSAWTKKFSILAKNSKKVAKASVTEEKPEEVEKKINEAFASVEKEKTPLVDSPPETKKSQKELFAEAFAGDNVTVK